MLKYLIYVTIIPVFHMHLIIGWILLIAYFSPEDKDKKIKKGLTFVFTRLKSYV